MRFAAIVEYDGSAYNGWQRQSHAPSVQAVVEQALSRVANQPLSLVCAGRTDTGVHATGQVVSFDTTAVRDPRAWVLGGNSNLPPDVSLRWVGAVADDFHARFSAVARQYRYLICNRIARSALLRNRACWQHRPLDAARMHEAAQVLVGEHDFSAFRSGACQAHHPVRTIELIEVRRQGEHLSIDIKANGFLHNMVRIIAGVLMAVGRGEADLGWPAELLRGRDRTLGGATAPPAGLYFVRAFYPERFELPGLEWRPCL